MTITYPLILLLILIVPLLVFARYYRKRTPYISFSDGQTLHQLPVAWTIRARIVLPLLFGVGLVLLIAAMARPRKGLQESRVRTEAVDIVLLVDISNSMREEDFSERPQQHLNRLDAAKEVLTRFIKERTDDRLGMVAFAGLPYTVSPLTLDHGWLLQRMGDLELGMLGDYGNSTAIGDALVSGINRLRESEAKSKVIVLLTDGNNNAGDISPENAAQAAKALDIKVYTVAAGAEYIRTPSLFGGFHRQPAEIDMTSLRRISDTTDALCFRARNLDELEEVYEEIDKMEKTKIEVDTFTSFEERFMPFLIAGLILIGLEKLLSSTLLGRLP